MSEELFYLGRNKAADKLVEVYHYSHKVPTNIQLCGTLIRDRQPIAAVFFSIPATRWSEKVLELCRLVRKEDVDPKPTLSQVISVACKQIKKKTEHDLLISFADSTQGHHGGIYQACSWNYHTIRKPRLDGFTIDGVLTAARTCNHRYGTSGQGLIKILEAQGHTCVPHFDKGKHLYWKALNKNGEEKAKRLGFTKSSYPKPDKTL